MSAEPVNGLVDVIPIGRRLRECRAVQENDAEEEIEEQHRETG